MQNGITLSLQSMVSVAQIIMYNFAHAYKNTYLPITVHMHAWMYIVTYLHLYYMYLAMVVYICTQMFNKIIIICLSKYTY